MTVTQPVLTRPDSQAAALNGRWSGFLHILGARMKELRREPEVIFWVFGFPILLALGLGLAFRNKPAEVTPVVVVSSPRATEIAGMLHTGEGSPIRADVRD